MGYAKIRMATDRHDTEGRNEALKEAAGSMTTAQLAQAARLTPSTVRKVLSK